jgi:hypothetical protein
MTDEREERLKRAMRAMDENTKAGAIDRALAHYLADKRAKAAIADDLATEHVEALSTPYLPIERETTVGD